MNIYPYKFEPIYKEKIWGGRNLERLFGRRLPDGKKIGESWELADLAEGASTVANGPEAGMGLRELTGQMGAALLGQAQPVGGGFPLLLKLLDANDVLSLQVHPDAAAVRRIGGDAALKTECWHVVESREGFIYKGLLPGATPQQFRAAVENDTAESLVKRYDVVAGDFHYLPAGTVHALGAGVVVAEVQTPSDTTYRVSDWGRGREIHVERSMECIHFAPADDRAPGASGQTLLATEYFTVALRTADAHHKQHLPQGQCIALMFLSGAKPIEVFHAGAIEPTVAVRAGDTLLLPAALRGGGAASSSAYSYLQITLPTGRWPQ